MPTDYREWCRVAKAFMLLSWGELEADREYPESLQVFHDKDFRVVIGATAIKYGALELGAALIQLEDEHLDYLLESGQHQFGGIDSIDPPEVVHVKFQDGLAGLRDHIYRRNDPGALTS